MIPLSRMGIGLALAVLLAPAAHAADDNSFDAALKDPSRPPYDIARDAAVKPAEVLAFANIKPGATIVDLIPGNGYYTRLFSKIAGAKGHVYAVVPRYGWTPPSPAMVSDAALQRRALAEDVRETAIADALHVADTAGYGNIDVLSFAVDQFGGQFSLPRQANVIWTANYEDFHKQTAAKANGAALDVVGLDKAIFAALKPGGVFVIEENLGTAGMGLSAAATLNRSESDVGDPNALKAEVMAAGFGFDGQSQISPNEVVLRFTKPDEAPRDQRQYTDAMSGYFGNTMISETPRHVFFHEDGTYQELGVPGPQAVQGGRWFSDSAGHICMLHDFDQRGTLTCYDIPSRRHVGDSWTSDTYGIGRMIKFRLEKGYVYPPGALTVK